MRSKGRQPSRPGRALIPLLTVRRLSLYLRYLEGLHEAGQTSVSSSHVGRDLGFSDAQVRKDLGYFGSFGRPGLGYNVAELIGRLREILGTDRTWNVALIGFGSLGRALLRHRGFLQKGFRIMAAFDVSPTKIGRRFGTATVYPMTELPSAVRRYQIRLAILAIPAENAQQAADAICQAGVKGILNFAPVTLTVPKNVAVIPVDLAVQLEQLGYLVQNR